MKNYKVTVNIFLNILTILLACAIVIVGLSINSILGIAIISVMSMLLIALQIYNFIIIKQLLKMLLQQKKLEEQKQKTINTLLDVYAILGIPPQYKPDGSLKDIYQLLGITPVYDTNGNRKLTIYEMLGINPKFTQSAVEIPSILRIKNRVNSLIKLDKSTAPLIYLPREKQIIGDKHVLPVIQETEKSKPDIKQVKVVKPVAKNTQPSKKSESVSFAKSIRQLPKAEKAKFGSTIKSESYKSDGKKAAPKDNPIVDAIFKVTSDATKLAAGVSAGLIGQTINNSIKVAVNETIKVDDASNTKQSTKINSGFKGQSINPQSNKVVFKEGFKGQFIKPIQLNKELNNGFSGQPVEDENQHMF